MDGMQTEPYLLLKQRAIFLRQEGKTYSEILREIPVAKSTLTIWLREVGLAKEQIQIISEKRIAAQKKGANARREIRQRRQEQLYTEAAKDISYINERDLFLLGIALYWAEGTKEKARNSGSGVSFNNMDPRMIRLFIKWLINCAKVEKDRICFEIYLHETSKQRINDVRAYWSNEISFSLEYFEKVYFKQGSINTNRKNTGLLYYGVLRVKVRASSDLLRRLEGWVRAINCQVV